MPAKSCFVRCLMALLAALLSFTSLATGEWKEKVLYSFQGGANDGSSPAGGVVFDAAGNLYGATEQGGGLCPPAQCGAVFQLAPPEKKGGRWTETVLHVFKGPASGDGNTPVGSVIIDSSGNLYGTTGYGGTGDCVLLGTLVGCGTVYELSPPAKKGGEWTETILYSFKSSKDGYLPNGELVFDSDGNLYGSTMFGGGKGTTCNSFYQYCGAVFELSPPKKKGGAWTEKVLHGFGGPPDGANPNGGLVLDSQGAIYGTTSAGGFDCPHHSGQGCGTVFKLTPPAKKGDTWTEKKLHVFTGGDDGGQPNAGLILDAHGTLYGVAGGGRSSGGGIVFSLELDKAGKWNETVLHWFSNAGPGTPLAHLLLNPIGDLYGTTGPGSLYGTVFRLSPPIQKGDRWKAVILYSFPGVPNGRWPTANVVLDKHGDLYGTTTEGGTGACSFDGCGTVFEVSP